MEGVHRPPLSGAARARIREARDAAARERAREARGQLDGGDRTRIRVPPPRRPLSELVQTRACRVEGCDEAANEDYDRGVFVNLCASHVEERRKELSRQTAERHRVPSVVVEWTAELVVEAILAWARQHGRFPKSMDWQRARNGEHRPTYDSVMRVFAGWREALAAAGFPEGAMLDDVHVDADGTVTIAGDTVVGEIHGDDWIPPTPAPTPSAERPKPPAAADVAPTLADLADRYEAARVQFDAAREALDEAGEALREHPLLAELLSGR